MIETGFESFKDSWLDPYVLLEHFCMYGRDRTLVVRWYSIDDNKLAKEYNFISASPRAREGKYLLQHRLNADLSTRGIV